MKLVVHRTPLQSKEPAGRSSRFRRRTLTGTGRSEYLEADSVRVFEKHTSGVGALNVCGQPLVVNDSAKLSKPLLRFFYFFDRADLKRQMVQSRLIRSKRPTTLLPQRQDKLIVLFQKRESTAFLIRSSGEIEAKDILVETL